MKTTPSGWVFFGALVISLILAGSPAPAATPAAEAPFPGKTSEYRGYQRFDFVVDGCPTIVVAPKQTAAGKPWIWRAEFFDAFPQVDLALLAKGFHLVYISVGNTFGCPDALKHWDVLYKELTAKHGLSPKPVLEGLSRGGLYCFNWAADHPDKVGCILGDNAVLDFKSWPAGKGKGKGSPGDWKKLLLDYHFRSEAEALAYAKNPVDKLAPLAKAKVPVFLLCGDADDVVPYPENGALVKERYEKLGGPVRVLIKKGLGHHPHGLDDPTPVVEFILQHTAAVAAGPASADKLIRNHTTWKDTEGKPIDCHEGGILRVEKTFYWYGRAYKGHKTGLYGKEGAQFRCGLNVYSSTDLVHWTYRGVCLSYPASGWVTEGTWHRPRVLYNDRTKKYVLWFFVHQSEYPCPLVVATADSPTGPFAILGAPAKGHTKGGDLALYKESGGPAYLVTGDSQANNLVFRLAADYLSTDGPPTIAMRNTGKRFEAASMARYKDKYIVAGSFMAGLAGSDTSYAVADSPLGAYTLKGAMSAPGTNTWQSQLSALVYVAESDRLFAICEQWFRGPKGESVAPEQSSQLWLPISFDPKTGAAKMLHEDAWNPWK